MKNNFEPFAVGTVFNECEVAGKVNRINDSVTVDYPSRLEAMALDPAQITDNKNLVYRAGQVDITVPLYKTVTVEVVSDSGSINISENSPRPSLVRHSAEIMKAALDIDDSLRIEVDDSVNLRHCGLGSSSSLIAGVATAINELYGRPVRPLHLARYLAQNHGEEIDDRESMLMPVQCIGGSAVCGNFNGGLIILAGEATPIFHADISESYQIVIGVPNDFEYPDSKQLMEAEIDNLDGFKKSGDQYARQTAYELVHQAMPSLAEGDIRTIGKLIYDYRWNMGSIKNCSFIFPRMLEIAEDLAAFYREGSADILSLSSVGPGFFAVTEQPNLAKERFEANNMSVVVTDVYNGKYKVTNAG